MAIVVDSGRKSPILLLKLYPLSVKPTLVAIRVCDHWYDCEESGDLMEHMGAMTDNHLIRRLLTQSQGQTKPEVRGRSGKAIAITNRPEGNVQSIQSLQWWRHCTPRKARTTHVTDKCSGSWAVHETSDEEFHAFPVYVVEPLSRRRSIGDGDPERMRLKSQRAWTKTRAFTNGIRNRPNNVNTRDSSSELRSIYGNGKDACF